MKLKEKATRAVNQSGFVNQKTPQHYRTFQCENMSNMKSIFHTTPPGCGKVPHGAKHTTKQAGNLSDNEVFSCSEFKILGLGTVHRKATGSTCFECLNPVPPSDLSSHLVGFKSQQGATKMPKVNTTTTPSTGTTPLTPRHEAIETNLMAALELVRSDSTHHSYQRAVGRAVRAASLLKQACKEAGANHE